jgi:hypothetical protein
MVRHVWHPDRVHAAWHVQVYQTQQQIEKLEREQAAHAQEAQQQQAASSSSDNADQAADADRAGSSGDAHAPAAADGAAHAAPEAFPATPAAPADAQSQVSCTWPCHTTVPWLTAGDACWLCASRPHACIAGEARQQCAGDQVRAVLSAHC